MILSGSKALKFFHCIEKLKKLSFFKTDSPPSSTSLNLEDLVLFCHKGHGLGVEVRWQGGEIACSLSPMLGPVNLNLGETLQNQEEGKGN